MSDFPILTADDAPEGSRQTLEAIKARVGMVPNILGVMAASPAVLKTYAAIQGNWGEALLTPVEQQVAIIAIAAENGCTYCVPAHSMAAKKAGMDADTLAALREGRDLPDPRHEALRTFALAVVRRRGKVADAEVQAFLDAGFTQAHILEVLLAAAQKTITNYLNHMADVPLDGVFEPERWEVPAAAAE